MYLAIRHASGSAVASRLIGAVATSLRQRDPGWSTCSRDEQTQSVLNAAARLIFMASKYDTTIMLPLLRNLHWLRVPERIDVKILVSFTGVFMI